MHAYQAVLRVEELKIRTHFTIPRPIAHLALKPTPDSSIFPQQGTIQSEPFIAAFLERGPS